jgi:CHAT domain-containing protein
MVSHWSISDKATRQLSEEIFKSAIKPSTRSYTEALDYGRKQLRKNQNFAHPFYWGAFKIYEPFSIKLSKEF